MRERYEIETIEQLRAIADMLRVRIIDTLEKRAMTVTQLGESLGLAPAKVHYHVRELERVGLLELVETREKGGILEKYYQPIAHVISVSKALLSTAPDEAQAMARTLLDQISDGYLRAFRHFADLPEEVAEAGMDINLIHLHITHEEQRQILQQFYDILKPFELRGDVADTHEVEMALVSYPVTLSAESAQVENRPVQASQVVGAVLYTRNDLLKAQVAGKRMKINVVGVCSFAKDIDAALVDQVVGSFKLVGKLLASAEIKDVLKSKEVQA